MINIIKFVSCLAMFIASAWFFFAPDFAPVLIGVLSLAAFMITFLPISTDQQI